MDAKTIGQKIKEYFKGYEKFDEEKLGNAYLKKYGWVKGIKSESKTQEKISQNKPLAYNYKARQTFVPNIGDSPASQVYDITQRNNEWANRMSKPGAVEEEVYGPPGSVLRQVLGK